MTEKLTEKVTEQVVEAVATGKSWKEKALKGAAIVGGVGIGGWVLMKVYRHFRPSQAQAAEAEAQA